MEHARLLGSIRLVPPVNGRVVARRIPGARFELIPNAGHVLVTDQLDASVLLMLAFLETQQKAKVG